jgi:CIC family chloride channel protein
VLIILEMTGGYGLTLPLMISNMMAYGVARHLSPTPIYEALLEQDGIQLHAKKPAADAIDRISVGSLKLDTSRCATFKPSELAVQLLEVVENAGRQEVFPVLDANQRLVGLITLEDLMGLAAEPDLDRLVCATDIMRPPVALRNHDLVSRALELMTSTGVRELPVVDDDHHVLGVVDEAAIAHEYVRVRAVERADAAASGVRAIDPEAVL